VIKATGEDSGELGRGAEVRLLRRGGALGRGGRL